MFVRAITPPEIYLPEFLLFWNRLLCFEKYSESYIPWYFKSTYINHSKLKAFPLIATFEKLQQEERAGLVPSRLIPCDTT